MSNLPELLDPQMLTAGFTATKLIAYPSTWINRRVETIELLSHEETRRRVSVDFTLSDELARGLATAEGIVVPISVLTKEARRNFDLRDESGAAVPVLGRHSNAELAQIAVTNAAVDALPESVTPDAFELVAGDLGQIVTSSPRSAEDALGVLVGGAEYGNELRAAIWTDETCRILLQTLSTNYVLFAVLPPGGPHRRILKYSYGDDFEGVGTAGTLRERLDPGWLGIRAAYPDRSRFFILCPGANRAASFHAEIAIPEELRIETAALYDMAGEHPVGNTDENVNRASLYARHALDGDSDINIFVEVAPERGGRPIQAAAAGVAVTFLLWLGVASGLQTDNPGPAVSLLLAGAALYSGAFAVRGKHVLVRRLFSASRRWLSVVASTALVASATLAMEFPEAHPVCVWWLAAIACTLASLRLVWSAIRAPS